MKGAWRTRSIRSQLVAAHAASVCVVLLVFAAGAYVLFRYTLTEGLHRELGREFEVVESLIDVTSTGVVRWRGDDDHDEAEYEGEQIAAEVWASPEELLVRTKAAQRWAPRAAKLHSDWEEEGFDVVQVGGEPVQVLQGRHDVAGRHFVIRIYRSAKAVRDVTTTLAWALLLALLIALTLAIAVSLRFVDRVFLEPLSSMVEHARLIGADHSGERLPIANPNDEIGHLGSVINDAFSRFDEAVSRLRRFTADASHELRTPLTSIRTVGEICLRSERSPEGYRDAIGSILEDVEGLSRLLDSLLLLSRADEGHGRLSKEPLSILEVVQGVADDIAVVAAQNDQSLTVTGDNSLRADIDPTVLRLALFNLLDNAIKYGVCESAIEAHVADVNGDIQIDVHNSGESIPPEHRARIFDRFYRGESVRDRAVAGSGLGLSVARWAVQMHGGTLHVEIDGRAGTTFRVRLPTESRARR